MPREERPTKHVPPVRTPRWGFGVTLRDPHRFVGRVDAIYADYWSALDFGAVSPGWFEGLTIPMSTKDQIFYSLIALDGDGVVLVGEAELEEA